MIAAVERSWREQKVVGGCRMLEQRRRPRGRRMLLARLRLAEIEQLIDHRHGGPVDTDDGPAYAAVAAQSLADVEAIKAWAAEWTPLVPDDVVQDIIGEAFEDKRRPLTADGIANVLHVNRAEREALGLCTVGATDFGAKGCVRSPQRRWGSTMTGDELDEALAAASAGLGEELAQARRDAMAALLERAADNLEGERK